MPKPADDLMTAEELADYLAVPLATLYAWRYRGDGPPAVKVGRHLRYRVEDVESWLATLAR
jgi:excisionase family DNA binding protein